MVGKRRKARSPVAARQRRDRLPVDITVPDSPGTVLYPFGTGLRK